MSEKPADMKMKKKKDDGFRSRLHILSSVILGIAVILCLITTIQVLANGYASICGFSMFRVVTGSMEPTIPVGAVLISRSTDIEDIGIGDIVCFRARETDHYGSIVTHRVVSVQTEADGTRCLETRGDANMVSDAYYVRESNLVGKVIWYTGKESSITNVIAFLSSSTGFLICIAFPILIIAGLILRYVTGTIRKDLLMAEYELRRGKIAEPVSESEELLPGYTTLTKKDYDEIYNKLKKELLEELNRCAE